MARLFGFIGNRPDLGSRVLEAEAAVVFAPVERGGAGTFGWGVGHYQGGEVLLRRRPVDENPTAGLMAAVADVRSDALLGHLRRATVGGHRTENTHPFRYRQYLFAHTGTVAAFAALRDRLVESLPEFLQRGVRGDTDSELLFHLFLSFLHDAGNLNTLGLDPGAVRGALRSTLSLVDRLSAEEGATPSPFHVAITDGEHVVVAHSGDRLVYRQLVGRADLEEVLGDDRLRRVRIPDMASCRFCLFAAAFDAPVPTPGFTEVPVGSIVTFTRASDPVVEPL